MIVSLWMLVLVSRIRNILGYSRLSYGCRKRISRSAQSCFRPIRITCLAAKDCEDKHDAIKNVLWLSDKEGSYRLAYQHVPPDHGIEFPPAVLFCNGFRSAMTGGTKVVALQDHCRKKGWEFCALDYRGHGLSSGVFEECTLTDWIRDASEILDGVLFEGQPKKRVVIVGSSMGAWIAIHLALQYNKEVHFESNTTSDFPIAGILGIASGPDFLQDMYSSSTAEQREEWKSQGIVHLPSRYGDPYPIPWNLIQDAVQHWGILPSTKSILSSSIATHELSVNCPVRLLHGKCDEDISWKKSKELLDLLNENAKANSSTAVLTLIEDGDHRLSRPQDIQLLLDTLDDMIDNQVEI